MSDTPNPPARTSFRMGWPEVIVGAAVACILLFTVWMVVASPFSSVGRRIGMSIALGQMKQLHLATQQMAMDGENLREPHLGWPGDTGGSFSHWAAMLVASNYLSTNDLVHLLRGPGHYGALDKIPTTNDLGILVYATRSNSPADTVFLSTWNFTNSPTGGGLVKPFPLLAYNGFAVMRQAGDGQLLPGRASGQTNRVGGYAPLCW